MALGDQSKSLRIMSLNKGWDPNVIQGTGENIANFNKAPDPIAGGDNCVGRLPQGIPDTFPEDHPSISPGSVPFNAPANAVWDSKSRATKGGDPFAGFGDQ